MIGASPSNGLALNLVMLFGGFSAKQLLQMASVNKNWRFELRRDEYWYRFRNHVLEKLPSLACFFERGVPIWKVFAKRLWPVAANLQQTCINIQKINSMLLGSIVIAFKPEKETVVSITNAETGYSNATVYGVIHVLYASGNSTSFCFKELRRDERLVKQLGLKRAKIEKLINTTALGIHVNCSSGKFFYGYNIVPRDFFLPYLKIVFPK
ncbi:MAG: hypothetical protein K2Q45_06850 [Nitrosomonas sp.]|nr:hypothetical protein [Nitrosomonas sp.]